MTDMSISSFFSGVVTINDTTISNIRINSGMFVLFQSNLEINNVQINDITRQENSFARFIGVESASFAKINNTSFNNINFSLTNVFASTVEVYNTSMKNITASSYIFECFRSEGIIFQNLTVEESQTVDRDTMFNFRGCTIESITDSSFKESQPLIATFVRSNLKIFDNNVLDAMNRGLLFSVKSSGNITNSRIINMVQNIKEGFIYSQELNHNGAAIQIVNSDLSIDNSEFTNNTSINGGAIFIDCQVSRKCLNTVSNSVFINNYAQAEGGAISYTSYEPILSNITYLNNTAFFKDDISSYAVEIKQIVDGELVEITELENIPSGVVIDEPIQLAIVSAEGSIMTKDSTSVIKLSSRKKGANVRGQTTVVVTEGRANFTETIFRSTPGAERVEYSLVSSAINYEALEALDPVKYQDHVVQVNFRWCKPGEVRVGNTCERCNIGTYSVKWNETECRPCPLNTACEGEVLRLNAGYWRLSTNSTDIIECPNEEACLGGYVPENNHPVY